MLNRRHFLGGLLASGVPGCASSPDSTFSLFSKTIAVKGALPNDYPLTAIQIQNLPYASLGVRIGDNSKVVMILADIDGDALRWVSADRVIFVTKRGRLVRTHGLSFDLGDTRFLGPNGNDPLHAFQDRGALPGGVVRRQLTLLPAGDAPVTVESRFEFGEHETITVQGKRHSVRQLDEIANVPAWRWETRNSFWIDSQTGRVWRSRQQYRPEIPPIELELLKPAAV